MKRRDFLRTAGAVAGTVLTRSPLLAREAARPPLNPDKRPNVLLIMTDQQSADALSCRMGTEFLSTPAMDDLASRGMFFQRAYTPNPLCIPARTSLFTGLPTHATGIQSNDKGSSLRRRCRVMGSIFREAGYDTGYFGKWHMPFPAADNAAHGFETMGAVKNDGVDKEIPGFAAEFMRRKRDAPFLLVTSFVNPHNICEWARGQELKNGDIGEPPPVSACPPAVKNLSPMKDEPDIIPLIRKSYQSSALFPVGQFDEAKWREYRWAYFRLIEAVDAQIGRIIRELRQTGLEGETVILFTSDHGDCQGAHGWNQKTVLFEESVRVPFIIVSPDSARGTTTDTLVNTGLDLLPTVCDYAGIEISVSPQGRSLKRAAEGSAPAHRPYIVVENLMVQGEPVNGQKLEPAGRMVRSEHFKYCAFDLGERRESLIDLERDPGEMTNLAMNSDYGKVLEQHRRYLGEWCRDTGDPFEVPGS